MLKIMSIKRLTAFAVSLSVLLLAGFIYAAVAGESLTIDGSVTLGPPLEEAMLEFVLIDGGEFVGNNLLTTATMTVDTTNKAIATIEVDLADFESEVEVFFNLLNTGSNDVQITSVELKNTFDDLIEISGDYEGLEDSIVEVGELATMFGEDIVITFIGDEDDWDDAYDKQEDGTLSIVFVIEIEYEVAS